MKKYTFIKIGSDVIIKWNGGYVRYALADRTHSVVDSNTIRISDFGDIEVDNIRSIYGQETAMAASDVVEQITSTGGGSGLGYDVYVALLTQSGTDAPVATVLQNTLGGTVVWSRDNTGEYTATLVGAFTVNKTIMIAGQNNGGMGFTVWSRNDDDSMYLGTGDGSGLADDKLDKTNIEIRVYP